MPTKQKMHKERKSKRRKNFIKRYMKYLFPVLIYAVLYFFCISIGVLGSIPENTNYEVGGVAEEDIVATKDVVDEYSTGLLREEAQQKVLPVYDTDENIVQQVEEKIISTFSACGTASCAKPVSGNTSGKRRNGSFRRGLGKRIKRQYGAVNGADSRIYYGAEYLYDCGTGRIRIGSIAGIGCGTHAGSADGGIVG